jgi:hypothetical protein
MSVSENSSSMVSSGQFVVAGVTAPRDSNVSSRDELIAEIEAVLQRGPH